MSYTWGGGGGGELFLQGEGGGEGKEGKGGGCLPQKRDSWQAAGDRLLRVCSLSGDNSSQAPAESDGVCDPLSPSSEGR